MQVNQTSVEVVRGSIARRVVFAMFGDREYEQFLSALDATERENT